MIDIIGDPLVQILSYLDFKSLVAVSEVNRSWENAVLEHRSIWLSYFKHALFMLNQDVQGRYPEYIQSDEMMDLKEQMIILGQLKEKGTSADLKVSTVFIQYR